MSRITRKELKSDKFALEVSHGITLFEQHKKEISRYGTIAGSNIKFAFIGNPDRCPSACEAQTIGPNGNAGADGMASIIAHELEEAVTDPNINAWYQGRYQENADKCAWTFGTTYNAANGAQANMRLGVRDFLIQQNWVNALGGYCALSY